MYLNTHKRAQKPQIRDLFGKHFPTPIWACFRNTLYVRRHRALRPRAAHALRELVPLLLLEIVRGRRDLDELGGSMGRGTHRSKEAARRAAECKSWLWCAVMTPDRLHAPRATHRRSLLHSKPLSAAQRKGHLNCCRSIACSFLTAGRKP